MHKLIVPEASGLAAHYHAGPRLWLVTCSDLLECGLMTVRRPDEFFLRLQPAVFQPLHKEAALQNSPASADADARCHVCLHVLAWPDFVAFENWEESAPCPHLKVNAV